MNTIPDFQTSSLTRHLSSSEVLMVRQKRELAELFGFETRNKYEISTAEGHPVAYCAEQQKGILGFLLRQYLGHWRRFSLIVFDIERVEIARATHPFRFFFQRLELTTASGVKIGALQQRFSILSKKFDLEGPNGEIIGRMHSGLFRLWTFPVLDKMELPVGKIEKKWGGALKEIFTDQDTFSVSFKAELPETEKLLLTVSAVFIDLQYFEHKG